MQNPCIQPRLPTAPQPGFGYFQGWDTHNPKLRISSKYLIYTYITERLWSECLLYKRGYIHFHLRSNAVHKVKFLTEWYWLIMQFFQFHSLQLLHRRMLPAALLLPRLCEPTASPGPPLSSAGSPRQVAPFNLGVSPADSTSPREPSNTTFMRHLGRKGNLWGSWWQPPKNSCLQLQTTKQLLPKYLLPSWFQLVFQPQLFSFVHMRTVLLPKPLVFFFFFLSHCN